MPLCHYVSYIKFAFFFPGEIFSGNMNMWCVYGATVAWSLEPGTKPEHSQVPQSQGRNTGAAIWDGISKMMQHTWDGISKMMQLTIQLEYVYLHYGQITYFRNADPDMCSLLLLGSCWTVLWHLDVWCFCAMKDVKDMGEQLGDRSLEWYWPIWAGLLLEPRYF